MAGRAIVPGNERVLAAAYGLSLERGGQMPPVREVAALLGLAHSTVYRHYRKFVSDGRLAAFAASNYHQYGVTKRGLIFVGAPECPVCKGALLE